VAGVLVYQRQVTAGYLLLAGFASVVGATVIASVQPAIIVSIGTFTRRVVLRPRTCGAG
jgi:hypothetical protein